MTFRLAHISDIHLGPLPQPTLRQLLSKRVTGYVNWQRNRAHTRDASVLAALTAALEREAPDHIAVTGDLMNIGLPEEIENTGQWLETLGTASAISVVPGNHDAYIRGILAKALTRWQPYLTGDSGNVIATNTDFPYLRVRGNIALIGINSAVATAPFVAAGRVTASQLSRMKTLLDQTRAEGLFRVIMIHHPPVHGAAKPHKRLYGIKAFQSVIIQSGAELILHGHTHLPQRHAIPGPADKSVPVIGVPSASEGLGAHRPPSAYNLFEISRSKTDGWACTLSEFSYAGPALPYTLTHKQAL